MEFLIIVHISCMFLFELEIYNRTRFQKLSLLSNRIFC